MKTLEQFTDKEWLDAAQLKKPYYPHQEKAVLYAKKHERFILGDQQGTGKTIEIIGIAMARKRLLHEKHCLIITCVNGLKYNWEDEIISATGEVPCMLGRRDDEDGESHIGSSRQKLSDLRHLPSNYFLILNVEALRYKRGKGRGKYVLAEKIEALCKSGSIGMIAVDEIHKNKNPEAKQTRGLMKFSARCMIAATGTLILNRPMDSYVPLKWLGIEKRNYKDFLKDYTIKGGWHNCEIVGYKNLDQMNRIVNDNMLRRKKSDVLSLPPKLRETAYVEMSEAEWKLYKSIMGKTVENVRKKREQLKENMRLNKHVNLSNPLSQWTYLRQVTGDASILSDAITKSSKMERLEDLVEQITEDGDKVIVFSEWTEITKRLRKRLAKYSPSYITGEVSLEERQAEKNRFQTDKNCKVIIGTTGAMGTGLTLTAASYVIFMDSPWTMALKEQCEDRAHRIGTTSNVNIITLVCKRTIDEYIEKLLAMKGTLASIILDPEEAKDGAEVMIDWLLEQSSEN
jgi:SNF2 family DNA or RNA helicase